MDRIWLRDYPPGVPADIDADTLPSLVGLIDAAIGRHRGRIAYRSMGRTMTYGELDRLADAFAAWLQRRGVRKGARVALMMPNLLQYPVCLVGALRAGAVVVACNPLYTSRELEHQLRDSGAEAIVIVENFAHVLEPVLARTAVRTVVVTSVGGMLGGIKGLLVDTVVRHLKRMVPPWSLPGAVRLSQALAEAAGTKPQPVPLAPSDPAFLQYTGGTTGVSKGAVLTHRNMVANVTQARAWLQDTVREGEELIVTALPLYHIFAMTANCLTFLVLGAENLLILNPRDLKAFVGELRRHRFTAITGVNTLFNALLAHPDFGRVDFSALRIALGGGMAVQQSVAERWQRATGMAITQAYGLTETSPAVTIDRFDRERFSGSIGLPLPSTEVSVRDDDGRELSAGEVGELCVRGPQVMAGYWKRPDETARVFWPGGWLRTGDIGRVDADGRVFLVDRKKDVILVSGFNVYPNEVEDVIASHPGVAEAAVVGVPDERTGERVKLFVVRRDPALDADALVAFARTQLTAYKVPHLVEFRDALPKTPVGKVLRRALRDGG